MQDVALLATRSTPSAKASSSVVRWERSVRTAWRSASGMPAGCRPGRGPGGVPARGRLRQRVRRSPTARCARRPAVLARPPPSRRAVPGRRPKARPAPGRSGRAPAHPPRRATVSRPRPPAVAPGARWRPPARAPRRRRRRGDGPPGGEWLRRPADGGAVVVQQDEEGHRRPDGPAARRATRLRPVPAGLRQGWGALRVRAGGNRRRKLRMRKAGMEPGHKRVSRRSPCVTHRNKRTQVA